MNELLSFWNSLAGNSVLLLVIMPVVGALLVRIMAVSGSETVYFTALTNVWLTTGLGVVLLFRFEANELRHPTGSLTMVHVSSSLDWLARTEAAPPDESSTSEASPRFTTSGPDIRFTVGVNRLGLWSILIIAATTLACLSIIPMNDPRLVSRVSWLLVTESALIGTFAAQDIVLLAFFIGASSLGLFFLTGMSTGLHYREAARRFFFVQMVSGLLLVIGLIGLAIAHWWMRYSPTTPQPTLTFSISGIVQGIPELAYSSESARGYWDAMAPWLFTLLVSGLAIRVPLAPLHAGWFRVVDHCDRGVLALASAGSLTFGFYAAATVIMPAFPDLTDEIGFRLMIWGVTAALLLSLMSISAETHRRRIGLASVAAFSLAFGVTYLDHPLAQQGGLLLTGGASAAAVVLFLIAPESSHHAPKTPSDPPCGHSRTFLGERGRNVSRVLRVALLYLAASGIAWLPLSGSFWGLILVLQSVFARNSTAAFCLIAAMLCLAVSAAKLLRSSDAPRVHPDAPRLLVLVPLIAILLVFALAPHAVTGPAN